MTGDTGDGGSGGDTSYQKSWERQQGPQRTGTRHIGDVGSSRDDVRMCRGHTLEDYLDYCNKKKIEKLRLNFLLTIK